MIAEPVAQLIVDIFNFLFRVGIILVVILGVYIGFQYTKSNPKETANLKKWIPWLIAALVLILVSQFIPAILKSFLSSSQ